MLIVIFLNEFVNYIEMKVFCREELLLLGDFNICVDVVDDNDVMKFFDLLEFFGFV